MSAARVSTAVRESREAAPWYVFTGTCAESSHSTWAAAMEAARRHAAYRKSRARVVLLRPAPDGDWVTTPPWAGGTWGGLCGSTRWLRSDTDPHRVECRERMRHLGRCRDSEGLELVRWNPYESIKYVPGTLDLG